MTNSHALHLALITLSEQTARVAQTYRAMADLFATIDPPREGEPVPMMYGPPTEMAVHAPTEPCAPSFDDVSDDVPGGSMLGSANAAATEYHARFAPSAERDPTLGPGAHIPTKGSGTRSVTLRTAVQWATDVSFVEYVSRTEPFSKWSATEQATWRDKFIAVHRDSHVQRARWGKTFAKFCNVKTGAN